MLRGHSPEFFLLAHACVSPDVGTRLLPFKQHGALRELIPIFYRGFIDKGQEGAYCLDIWHLSKNEHQADYGYCISRISSPLRSLSTWVP